MSLLVVLPLAALALTAIAGIAGALAARHLRHRSNYTPAVLAAGAAPAAVVSATAAAAAAPVGVTLFLLAVWAAFGAGARAYVATRWARDYGVGELGAAHRERIGLRGFGRDLADREWRTRLQRDAAEQLLTVDGRRCILGPQVARRDRRPTGEQVTVKLGAVTPGAGGNSGVVGLLLGRPESGKTTTAIRLLHASAEADPAGAIIVVDPKGDHALRQAARDIADRHGTSHWEWGLAQPLDPLASAVADRDLAVQAAVARIMASQTFTEEYYKGVAQDAYTDAAEHLLLAERPLSLAQMAAALEPAGARALLASLRERHGEGTLWRDHFERVSDWFKAQDQRSWQNLAGAASRLRSLTRSGLGAAFAAEADGGRTISDLASRPGVSYLHLDAGMWPDAALQVAELLAVGLMQDVGRIAQHSQHTITMFIDEVGAVPATRMDAMLQRGRSAGFSVILAAQTLAGIGAVAPQLVSQITGTLSWLIGHASIGQSEAGEDDAERIGRLAGTRIEHELTTQTAAGSLALPTGAGSRRQVDAYLLHPNLIRSLPRGHAVVIDADQPTTSPERGRLCAVSRVETADTENQERR